MAIVKAKLRLTSLSQKCLSSTLSHSSHIQEQEYHQNDAATINNTTSQQIVKKLYSLIQHYHHQNPISISHQFAPNPNLKIPSLSLAFSKITSLPSTQPLTPIIIQGVIDKCCNVRENPPFLGALALFNWATSRCKFSHAPDVYNEMIDFAGKLRNFGLVWDLIDLMESRNVRVTGLTGFIVVGRYVRAGLIAEAVNVFDRMRDYGCEMDGFAFRDAIRYLCTKKNAIEAQWFFDRLKDRFEPDVSVYNSLLEVWSSGENLLEVKNVFLDMKRVGVMPNVCSYNAMIDVLCESGQIERAREVFEEMVNAGCKPNMVTFNSLLFAHLKEGKHDKVLDVYDKMKRFECPLGTITCNYVMEAHCKENNIEEAIELLDFMYKNGCVPNVRTYNLLFGSVARLKHVKSAQLVFERIKELKIKPAILVYNQLILMFAKSKSVDMVIKLKEEMEEKKIAPNGATYHILLRVFVKKGQWENAYKFFIEMIEEKQLRPEQRTYALVTKQLKRVGRVELVKELAEKMAACGFHALPSK